LVISKAVREMISQKVQ